MAADYPPMPQDPASGSNRFATEGIGRCNNVVRRMIER
jgi:hypothetical protein